MYLPFICLICIKCQFVCRFYDELLMAGVIREFTGKIVGPNRFGGGSKHFVAPQGINSVVKHFLNEQGKFCNRNCCRDTSNLRINICRLNW